MLTHFGEVILSARLGRNEQKRNVKDNTIRNRLPEVARVLSPLGPAASGIFLFVAGGSRVGGGPRGSIQIAERRGPFVRFRDDDQSGFRDVESSLAIQVVVVADLHAFGNLHTFVDDRPPDASVTSDGHVAEQNRLARRPNC